MHNSPSIGQSELEQVKLQLRIREAADRIMNRALAMHHTSELQEVINIVGEQFRSLKLDITGGAFISINAEIEKDLYVWGTGGTANYAQRVRVPFYNRPIFTGITNHIKNGSGLLLESFNRNQKVAFFKHLFKYPPYNKTTQAHQKKVIAREGGYTRAIYTSEHTSIFIINHHGRKFSDTDHQVLIRFAEVFEQAYRRFLDLQKAEDQARDAQVEAALERVRAQTIAMYNSEDVGKCIVKMFGELTALGVDEGTRFGIGILNHDNENNQLWTASKDGEEVKMHIGNLEMTLHPLLKSARKAWKEQVPLHKYVLEGEDLLNYYQMLNNAPDYKIRIAIEKLPEREIHYGFVFDHGFFYAFNTREFQTDIIHIIHRFSSLFGQTYRRYLDLVKAETQAREAQIETSLERIRASAMAMHMPEDLPITVNTFFNELKRLGVVPIRCGVAEVHENSKSWDIAVTNSLEQGKSYQLFGAIKNLGHPVLEDIYQHWEIQKEYYPILKGNDIASYYKVLRPQIAVPAFSAGEVHHGNYFYFKEGCLFAWTDRPLKEEEVQIFRRFTSTLSLTYQRYKDLQKAEVQAREAQIETALERVRSASMAMHHSEDLNQVISTVFNQLHQLGFEAVQCEIVLFDPVTNDCEIWPSNKTENVLPRSYRIPYTDRAFYQFLLNAWKTKADYKPYQLKGRTKTSYEKWLFTQTDWKDIPQSVQDSMRELKRVNLYGATTKHGILEVGGEALISDEEFDIIKRFAKVFEQSYTRFLDIKKAEAQAREAQIEAALERVRSASMAMHKSEELSDVATVMFDQMKLLGGELFAFGIVLCDKHENMVEQWHSLGDEGMMTPFHVPIDLDYIHRYRYDQWKAGTELFSIEIPADYIVRHFELMFEIPSVQAAKEELEAKGIEVIPPPWEIDYGASFKNGYLLVSSLEPFEEEHIFSRFATVFEQAYTRFLDLQKAEAQAREAQIEAALERVRAASMAMHQSQELVNVATIVYNQLISLGFDSVVSGGFNFPDEEKNITKCWFADTENEGLLQDFEIPFGGDPVLDERNEYREKNIPFLEQILRKEELRKHMEFVFPVTTASEEEGAAREAMPDPTVFSIQFLKWGYVILISTESLNVEQKSVLDRLANAFNLAYTRFLDLQKAEAQAEEARIEAALEKIRSRSLAMHKSDEISEVVWTVMQKMTELDIEMNGGVSLATFIPGSKDLLHWYVNPDHPSSPKSMRLPYFKNLLFEEFNEAREKGAEWLARVYNFDEKNEYFRYAFKHSEFKNIPEELKNWILEQPTFGYTVVIEKNCCIFLNDYTGKLFSEKENKIFKRFSRVFEQAYIRFLDLKKAEEQAKEAQIEAALEKVRSRTIGMQKSDELKEVIQLVYDQLVQLDIFVEHSGFIMDYKARDDMLIWLADPKGVPSQVVIPYFDSPHWNSFIEAKAKGASFFANYLTFDEKNKFYRKLFDFIPGIPKKAKKHYLSCQGLAISTVLMENVALYIENFSGIPYTDEENDTLLRFGKVFQQTYTRFLDLQKAEAQAREAQIEAALERVRSKALSMHRSEELAQLVDKVFDELTHLDFELTRCIIWIFDPDSKDARMWMANAEAEANVLSFHIPYHKHASYRAFLKAWSDRKTNWVYTLKGKTKVSWDEILFNNTELKSLPGEVIEGMRAPNQVILTACFNDFGALQTAGLQPLGDESKETLKRFGKVFDQGYTRFHDLQKAEAQAREAQIELSLERIRAKAMAMNKSSDLLDIVVTMRNEFIALGHEAHYFWHMRWLPDKYEKAMTSGDGTRIGMIMDLPRHIHGEINLLDKWEKSTDPTVVYVMDAEAAVDYVGKMITLGDFKQIDPNAPSNDDIRQIGGLTYVMARTMHGEIGYSLPGNVPDPPEDDIRTLERLASTFDLAYRRFEDLKTTEHQNRETQIELGLERVRSRAIAMHHSDELSEVVSQLFNSLDSLGFDNNVCNVSLIDPDTRVTNLWTTHQTKEDLSTYHVVIPDVAHPFYDELIKIHAKRNPFSVLELQGKQRQSWSKILSQLVDYSGAPKEVRKANAKIADSDERIVLSAATMKYGMLIASGSAPILDEEADILQRFSKVFEQTYTRFLDLQKAEEQAREAQIEAALERVRVKALNMHRSGELAQLVDKVFDELTHLNFELTRCIIWVFDPETKDARMWMANAEAEANVLSFHIPYHKHASYRAFLKAWSDRKTNWVYTLKGKTKVSWDDILFNDTELKSLPGEVIEGMKAPNQVILTACFNDFGALQTAGLQPLGDESKEILKRFAKVFDQGYTRFHDLQKAEAQAREAEIQLSLERVRSRSMAMHSSEELSDVLSLLFQQFDILGINPAFAHLTLFDDTNDTFSFRMTGLSGQRILFEQIIDIKEMESWKDAYREWKEGDEKTVSCIDYPPEVLPQVFEIMSEIFANLPSDSRLKIEDFPDGLYTTQGHCKYGYLGFNNTRRATEEEKEIVARFAREFGLVYQRFLDLQKAEAQAREAQIETGLEKVRASSLAMQKTSDLQNVVDAVFVEMNKLNIGMDHTAIVTLIDDSQDYHVWVGSADANFSAASVIPYNNLTQVQRDYNETIKTRPSFIAKKYTGAIKKEYSKYLFSQTGFKDNTPEKELRLMMDGDSLITSIAMFENTGIQIVSYQEHEFSENDNTILSRFANVFEQAYIRFLDLKQAEHQALLIRQEKNRLEKTLEELKATQSQLIHAEKMASLGELTAGIAHEIKNPLNFVNNFSEVSEELLDDMVEEIKAGDTEEAFEIIEDLKGNLKRIIEHGKRADSIVKGMLMHSRGSSTEKELTDMNALCDEYLRLAYHGLRAKDKSFNADMGADLDKSLPMIQIAPQEIGRVILNLITNAFHAVNERRLENRSEEYKPLVQIKTKHENGTVKIEVTDNGGGIPANIKDKIFQPFFTTKPTGQGTGLGLSLSYDIVKAHDGEILVNTEPETGTTFSIIIPIA